MSDIEIINTLIAEGYEVTNIELDRIDEGKHYIYFNVTLQPPTEYIITFNVDLSK